MTFQIGDLCVKQINCFYNYTLGLDIIEVDLLKTAKKLLNLGLVSISADTDTIFDDFSFEYISKAYFDESKGCFWQVEGEANGYHKKEIDISGQAITLTVTVIAPIVLGKFGLGNLEIADIYSEPIY